MAKPSRGGRRGGGGGGGSNLPAVISQPSKNPSATPGNIKPPEKPHTEAQALEMTNKKNYSTARGYQINCQRCIWAYEMNRRGYNVEALPNNNNFGTGDQWMSIAKNAKKEYAFDDIWGKHTNAGAAKAVKEKMAEWGEGSRAVIQMARRSHSGHVFNVEYKNGKVTVFEAQTGEVHKSLSKYLSEQKAVPGYVRFFRTDNLDLDANEFPKYVKQRE